MKQPADHDSELPEGWAATAIGDATVEASAPKGRNTKAQGNTLGKQVGIDVGALKGRNPDATGNPSRPYRATDDVVGALTRALPWAFISCPVGAEQRRQRT